MLAGNKGRRRRLSQQHGAGESSPQSGERSPGSPPGSFQKHKVDPRPANVVPKRTRSCQYADGPTAPTNTKLFSEERDKPEPAEAQSASTVATAVKYDPNDELAAGRVRL